MIIAYANILHVNSWTGQQYFHFALLSLSPKVNVIASIANIIWEYFVWDLEITGPVFD